MSRCDVRAGWHGGSIKIPGMKHVALPIALAGFVMSVPAGAEEARNFSKDQIATGAELYAVNCSPCHGARMQEPGAAFNLRKFPPDQRERFVNSVTRGKNQMPPWGDFFKPEQLEALWAYVMAGERASLARGTAAVRVSKDKAAACVDTYRLVRLVGMRTRGTREAFTTSRAFPNKPRAAAPA